MTGAAVLAHNPGYGEEGASRLTQRSKINIP
jgi:hypothetical protein